jgi:hypothetical protein
MWVGTAVLAVGAVLPLLLPFSTRATAVSQAEVEAAERHAATGQLASIPA